MYNIFTGKQRGLVFPVLCNGFVTIDYAKNIPNFGTPNDTTDDVTYGIWAHTGSFTIEAVLTPYDIMGAGTFTATQTAVPNRLNSKKIFPSRTSVERQFGAGDFQGEEYLGNLLRSNHKMAIFSSSNFSLYLQGDNTSNVVNRHFPSQYTLTVEMKKGTNPTRLLNGCPTVIFPNNSSFLKYTSAGDLEGIRINRKQFIPIGDVDAVVPINSPPATVSIQGVNYPNATFDFTEYSLTHSELFIRNGSTYINIGKAVTGNTQNLNFISISAENQAIINAGTELYIRDRADPSYINNTFHIACSYDSVSDEVAFYLNGTKVHSEIHPDSGTFSFNREDFHIGANGQGNTGAGSANSNHQFMGELHELSIVNKRKNVFSSLSNLTPTYDDTLVYLRFEEVDE